MENYTPNSHKYRAEQEQKEQKEAAVEKRVEKVVQGTVKKKKKSEASKLADNIITSDVASVKSYLFNDLFIPWIKELAYNVVTDTVDMLLFEGTRKHKKKSNGNASYTNYSGISKSDRNRSSRAGRSRYNFDEIIIDNKGEAEEVLDRMEELLDEYQMVTVGDFYDLVGEKTTYTDYKYGWTDLRDADIQRIRGGEYIIKLPRVSPIN